MNHEMICINCGRDESQVPVTAWRLAGQPFWICPDCLPLLIHRRSEVMPKWKLGGQAGVAASGGQHAEG